jgi:hypothetical protein
MSSTNPYLHISNQQLRIQIRNKNKSLRKMSRDTHTKIGHLQSQQHNPKNNGQDVEIGGKVVVLQTMQDKRMKKECQEMENDEAKLVVKLEKEAEPKPTTSTLMTPILLAVQSETSRDSRGNNKAKDTFKKP